MSALRSARDGLSCAREGAAAGGGGGGECAAGLAPNAPLRKPKARLATEGF